MKGWYKESYRHYLASKGVKTAKRMKPYEFIIGGRADGRPCSDFDSEQIKKGIKVEMEHTTNPRIAAEIARDHLSEDPKYYDHLIAMEKKYMADKRYFAMHWEKMIKAEKNPESKTLQKLIDDDNFAVSSAAKARQKELYDKHSAVEGLSMSEKSDVVKSMTKEESEAENERFQKAMDERDYGEEQEERADTHKIGSYTGFELGDKMIHAGALDALKDMSKNDPNRFKQWSKVVMKKTAKDGTIPTELARDIYEDWDKRKRKND